MYREKAAPTFMLEGVEIKEIGTLEIDLVLHKNKPIEGAEKLPFKETQVVENLRHAMFWITQDAVYPPVNLKAYKVVDNIRYYRLKYFARRLKTFINFFVDTDEGLIVVASLWALSTKKK